MFMEFYGEPGRIGPLIINMMLPTVIELFQFSERSKLWIVHNQGETRNYQYMAEYVANICSAPFGTFTEIVMELGVDLSVGDSADAHLFELMITEPNDEIDEILVTEEALWCLDEVELWLRPWLTLNEDTMKQIGLRKLDVDFKFGFEIDEEFRVEYAENQDAKDLITLQVKRIQAVLNERAAGWLSERAAIWRQIDGKCEIEIERIDDCRIHILRCTE